MNKKIKNIIPLLIITLFSHISYAQQDIMLTQYASAIQLTNPAYVGTSGRLNVTGIARNQWVGYDGAPTSQVLLVNTPVLGQRFGVGLNLIHDEIGPTKNTLVYFNTAYNLPLTNKIKLSMGLSGGFNVNKLNTGNFKTEVYDPALYDENQTEFKPNFGTGLYIYSPKFYVGISTPKLLTNKLAGTNELDDAKGEVRHFFIIGGYLFKVNEFWKLKPSTSIRMVKGAPISVDLTFNAIYNDKVWLGLMHRIGDGMGAIFQYQLTDRIRLGYSYDQPFTQLRNSAGSHEILISYDLFFKVKKLVTPRYF